MAVVTGPTVQLLESLHCEKDPRPAHVSRPSRSPLVLEESQPHELRYMRDGSGSPIEKGPAARFPCLAFSPTPRHFVLQNFLFLSTFPSKPHFYPDDFGEVPGAELVLRAFSAALFLPPYLPQKHCLKP